MSGDTSTGVFRPGRDDPFDLFRRGVFFKHRFAIDREVEMSVTILSDYYTAVSRAPGPTCTGPVPEGTRGAIPPGIT